MNADGGSFPENMKVFGDMVTHNLTFDPLEGRANLMINSPLPDDWFMLAHTNKRDEEMDFVERVSYKIIALWCIYRKYTRKTKCCRKIYFHNEILATFIYDHRNVLFCRKSD